MFDTFRFGLADLSLYPSVIEALSRHAQFEGVAAYTVSKEKPDTIDPIRNPTHYHQYMTFSGKSYMMSGKLVFESPTGYRFYGGINMIKNEFYVELSLPKFAYGNNLANVVRPTIAPILSKESLAESCVFIRAFARWWDLNICPMPWQSVQLLRIDLCANYVCSTEAYANEWVKQINRKRKKGARTDMQGYGVYDNGMFVKNDNCSYRAYNKGLEWSRVDKRTWKETPSPIQNLAKRTIRFEMTFRPGWFRYHFWCKYWKESVFANWITWAWYLNKNHDDHLAVRERKLNKTWSISSQTHLKKWAELVNKQPMLLIAKSATPIYKAGDLPSLAVWYRDILGYAYERFYNFVQEYQFQRVTVIETLSDELAARGCPLHVQYETGLISKSTFYRKRSQLGNKIDLEINQHPMDAVENVLAQNKATWFLRYIS